MTQRHFTRHGRGVFTCAICERRTRETTQGSTDSSLCAQCWELAGYENQKSDDPDSWTVADQQAVHRLIDEAIKRGGNGAEIMRQFPSLIPSDVA
jgi:hypothetical protein